MKIPLPRISNIHRVITAAVASTLLLAGAARGAEGLASQPPVALVSGDKTALPIILPENAAPHTKAAAKFLADTIEKIGGVRPEIF